MGDYNFVFFKRGNGVGNGWREGERGKAFYKNIGGVGGKWVGG